MERLTARERAEWGEEVGRGGVPAGDTVQMPAYCLRAGVWLLGAHEEVARLLLTSSEP